LCYNTGNVVNTQAEIPMMTEPRKARKNIQPRRCKKSARAKQKATGQSPGRYSIDRAKWRAKWVRSLHHPLRDSPSNYAAR
jgi:hypothetical protein